LDVRKFSFSNQVVDNWNYFLKHAASQSVFFLDVWYPRFVSG